MIINCDGMSLLFKSKFRHKMFYVSALPAIENGSQDGDCAPGVSGSVCTYKCNEGFTLNGNPEFLCQNDESWDKRDIPNCSPNTREGVRCPDINGLENGVTYGTCTQAIADKKCSFQCNDGYELYGPQEITCGADGNWNEESPQCSEVGTTSEPVTNEPATTEPVTDETTTSEPVTEEPVTEEPVTSEPVTEEPVTSEPVTKEPVTSEPVTKEPVTTEPVTKEPATTEPVTKEPATSEPETKEPNTKEPVTSEPVTSEPKTCPSLNPTPNGRGKSNINMDGTCDPGQSEKQCTLVCANGIYSVQMFWKIYELLY